MCFDKLADKLLNNPNIRDKFFPKIKWGLAITPREEEYILHSHEICKQYVEKIFKEYEGKLNRSDALLKMALFLIVKYRYKQSIDENWRLNRSLLEKSMKETLTYHYNDTDMVKYLINSFWPQTPQAVDHLRHFANADPSDQRKLYRFIDDSLVKRIVQIFDAIPNHRQCADSFARIQQSYTKKKGPFQLKKEEIYSVTDYRREYVCSLAYPSYSEDRSFKRYFFLASTAIILVTLNILANIDIAFSLSLLPFSGMLSSSGLLFASLMVACIYSNFRYNFSVRPEEEFYTKRDISIIDYNNVSTYEEDRNKSHISKLFTIDNRSLFLPRDYLERRVSNLIKFLCLLLKDGNLCDEKGKPLFVDSETFKNVNPELVTNVDVKYADDIRLFAYKLCQASELLARFMLQEKLVNKGPNFTHDKQAINNYHFFIVRWDPRWANNLQHRRFNVNMHVSGYEEKNMVLEPKYAPGFKGFAEHVKDTFLSDPLLKLAGKAITKVAEVSRSTVSSGFSMLVGQPSTNNMSVVEHRPVVPDIGAGVTDLSQSRS